MMAFAGADRMQDGMRRSFGKPVDRAARVKAYSEVLTVSVDPRNVKAANIERLGLADRCKAVWWDAREEPVEGRFDLALVNPPFHQGGMEVDFAPAMAIFDSIPKWIKPGSRALVVANTTLPYEGPLAEMGETTTLKTERGYKLMSLKRSARSSSARGRRSPASRSSGKVNWPTRSR